MLQQILNDMYIEPELLAELDEEQKQILFCKMREEQVRRWREREEKIQKEDNNRINSRKKKDGGKKVTFLMGVDGEPMVVVLGGEGGAQREDVDSILEERAKRQADLEADMLKRAAEEELDKLVRLSRSTVEAMEEEATRTSSNKVRDPTREAVVRSLQEATVEMEGQIQALEEAEAFQRKLSASSSSSSSGASSPSSPSPSSSSTSSSSSSSSSSSGIGSMGSPRLALSSSPSTSSLSSLSSFTSSQPPSPPAFTISAYGSSATSSRRLGGGSGVSMWDAVNKASHLPSSSTATSSSSSSSSSSSPAVSSVLSPSNFSSVVKPPILTPKPTTIPPPQPLRASQPSVSPPSSLSSTTSTFSSSSPTSSSTTTSTSALPSSTGEAPLYPPSSTPSSVVGVAAQIRRFEQLSEGSLEALKTATLERAKKRREREIFEHLRSQVEAARQQAASADSRQQQAAENADRVWQEQERKAKEAERRIREIARRAREEHRRTSQNTPPASPPASALNYNLNGLMHLTNGINGSIHPAATPPTGDINGNVNSVADDISNNNDSISLKKYSTSSSCSSSSSSPGNPGVEGFCIRQRLRPPKPPSRAAIISWFRDEELPRGTGLDTSCSRIAPWFHGIISRTEAEEVLSEAGIGCFLVRVSERIWGYAISYRAPDRCRHYLIDVTGGKYTFFGSHQASYDSLGDLIEHHKREAITVSGGELLTRPCGQMHPKNPDYRELFIGTPYLAA